MRESGMSLEVTLVREVTLIRKSFLNIPEIPVRSRTILIIVKGIIPHFWSCVTKGQLSKVCLGRSSVLQPKPATSKEAVCEDKSDKAPNILSEWWEVLGTGYKAATHPPSP